MRIAAAAAIVLSFVIIACADETCTPECAGDGTGSSASGVGLRCEGPLLVTCRSYAHAAELEQAVDCSVTGAACVADATGARCERSAGGGPPPRGS